MAQKKTTKKTTTSSKKSSKKKSPLGVFISAVVVIGGLALGYTKYNNDEDFQAEVNNKVETVKQTTKETTSKAKDSAKTTSTKTETAKTETKTTTKKSTSKTAGNIALEKGLEIPICAGTKGGKDHQIRSFEHYGICYRESYEQAEWSAYELTVEQLVKNAGRSNDFREDPKITTGSATLEDYKGSGYDRGHLTPAADMSFDANAMSETFYMSNMSPQAGSFNRGIWKDLEAKVRDWARAFGRVYVISGPILDKAASKYESIGKNKVSIPQYYYKVILAPLYADANDKKTPDDAKDITAIGFILPNNACEGKTYTDFACSIDEVEKRTGLDFYSLLEDKAEDSVEKNFDISLWK